MVGTCAMTLTPVNWVQKSKAHWTIFKFGAKTRIFAPDLINIAVINFSGQAYLL